MLLRTVLEAVDPAVRQAVDKRDDLTFWTTLLGLIVGILTLVGMVYGFTVFIMRRFRNMLNEEVVPIVEKIVHPIRDEQRVVREELRIHMAVEQSLLSQNTVQLTAVKEWQSAVLAEVTGIKQALEDRPLDD